MKCLETMGLFENSLLRLFAHIVFKNLWDYLLITTIIYLYCSYQYEYHTVYEIPIPLNSYLIIIVKLQNPGVYKIYNPKALNCGAQAK